MRDINKVAKEMAKNGLKIAKSLGCAFHFESEFISYFLIIKDLDKLGIIKITITTSVL